MRNLICAILLACVAMGAGIVYYKTTRPPHAMRVADLPSCKAGTIVVHDSRNMRFSAAAEGGGHFTVPVSCHDGTWRVGF